MKLGQEITVTKKYVRKSYSPTYNMHYTKLKWEPVDIEPTKGIVVGVRTISDGGMGGDGFFFTQTFKCLLVAINLKSIIRVPYVEH